jgi:hypothetical protein
MNARFRSWTLIRKTSLLHKIGPMTRRSSFVNKIVLQLSSHLAMQAKRRKRSGDSEGSAQIALHDPTRIDLLFTMSEITHAAPSGVEHAKLFCLRGLWWSLAPARLRPSGLRRGSLRFLLACRAVAPKERRLVEPDGIEPTTSCLQSTRSPS